MTVQYISEELKKQKSFQRTFHLAVQTTEIHFYSDF